MVIQVINEFDIFAHEYYRRVANQHPVARMGPPGQMRGTDLHASTVGEISRPRSLRYLNTLDQWPDPGCRQADFSRHRRHAEARLPVGHHQSRLLHVFRIAQAIRPASKACCVEVAESAATPAVARRPRPASWR